MMHQASIGLGLDMRYLAERGDDPAAVVSGSFTIGSAMSDTDLGSFARECGVVTFDHEVVDLEGLGDVERGGAVIRPPVRTLSVVADKLGMRRAVEWAGLPVPPWKRVRNPSEALAAMDEWPVLVLKPARGGYDGRGVFIVRAETEVRDLVIRLTARSPNLMSEPLLDIDAELAVLVARSPDGTTVTYDPVTTLQVDGQCRQVMAPAGLSDNLLAEARRIAHTAAEAIGVIGIMAVELFMVDGSMMVNELAARPHNSGHHTIDACVTSQFENHLRAVADLPLGDPSLRTAHAAMVNVIGAADAVDPRRHLGDAFARDPGCHVHLYGKEPRPNRKLGHVTVTGPDANQARRTAWDVVEALRADVPDGVAS